MKKEEKSKDLQDKKNLDVSKITSIKEIKPEFEVKEIKKDPVQNKVLSLDDLENFNENDRLNNFLMNQKKMTSLDMRNAVFSKSLESTLPQKSQIPEEDQPIDYLGSQKNTSPEYQKPEASTNIDESWKSEEQKNWERQQRFYDAGIHDKNKNGPNPIGFTEPDAQKYIRPKGV